MWGAKIDFEFVTSYQQAKQRWESVKPIRGNDDDIRPLGNRRKQHMRVIKNPDDSYSCRLYNTDCVTYKPNGDIELQINGWTTPSTSAFMSKCLPYKYWVAGRSGTIHLVVDDSEGRTPYIIPNHDVLTIKASGEIVGMQTPTKSVVDKEATAARREPFKPFLKWAKGFLKMFGDSIGEIDRKELWGLGQKADRFLLNAAEVSEDDYMNILIGLMHNTNGNKYYFNAKPLNQVTYSEVRALVARATQVRKEVELPIGSWQK